MLRTVIHMDEAVPQSDLHLDVHFDRCAPAPLQTADPTAATAPAASSVPASFVTSSHTGWKKM